MSKPLNARRPELRLPCDKPEPPRVVLERLPPRSRRGPSALIVAIGTAIVCALIALLFRR